MYVNTQLRWCHIIVLNKSYRKGTGRRNGGRRERGLSEVNTRAVTGGQNELIDIPTGIKRELVRSDAGCDHLF